MPVSENQPSAGMKHNVSESKIQLGVSKTENTDSSLISYAWLFMQSSVQRDWEKSTRFGTGILKQGMPSTEEPGEM